MSYWVWHSTAFEATGALDRAFAEMRGRVALWNALVALERERLAAYRALRARHLPAALQAFATQYEAAGPAQRTLRHEAPEAYRAYRAACQALRTDAAFSAATQALDASYADQVRALVRASGLYWCNSDAILAAWRVARRAPDHLRFHAWRDHAALTVRWQQGLPMTKLLAGRDTRAHLVPHPDRPVRPGRARRGQWPALLRVRVASTGPRRAPLWLELPVLVHRPLPLEATVRQIVVRWREQARRGRWLISLVCDLPAPAGAALVRPPGAGTIAIDIGWRRRPGGGLRVAAWCDDRGQTGEVVLPPRLLQALQKPEDLRSIRDQGFAPVHADLQAWLKQQPGLPDWLAAETTHVAQWRSPARLHRLLARWRVQRFPGDAAIYARLEAWRLRDLHLWRWEAHGREQALGWRRHLYRQFAAEVVRRYAAIRLEAFDLRPVVTRGRHGGQADDLPAEARHMRFLAAPHTLRLALQHAAERAGVAIEPVPAAWTTQRCCACGALMAVDAAPTIAIACPHCGAAHDQDLNAARNLLAWQPAAS